MKQTGQELSEVQQKVGGRKDRNLSLQFHMQ